MVFFLTVLKAAAAIVGGCAGAGLGIASIKKAVDERKQEEAVEEKEVEDEG